MPSSAVPPRGPAPGPSSSANIETAHSLALLTEYTHTLDSLPIDLSRNFADLRELDAVLSSSMISITAKIHQLTQMIEHGTASKEERLWLLTEVAEEAVRLKMGGEDKIRVACLAADNMKAHSAHLRTLLEHVPGFDLALLNRRTTYPHVAARSFMPISSLETGRRRRGGFGSLLLANNNHADPSPAKRKRVPKDDDVDIGSTKSPRKDKLEPAPRARNNQRKKIERPPSPSESLVSVTSHLPPAQHPTHARTSSTNPRGGGGGAPAPAPKRRGAQSHAHRNPTPLVADPYPPPAPQPHEYHVPPSSSAAAHPSLPLPYQPPQYEQQPPLTTEWTPPHAAQLEGPGMPVRGTSIHSAVSAVPLAGPGAGAGSVVGTDAATEAGDEGEVDPDDNKRYCFCNGVSYGEMIACDDAQCEIEWFHLQCIHLQVPPEGTWYCDSCKTRRSTKRTGRGGKRRTAGGRGAKNT